MAGHREDGTFAEDKAHHPNRKVSAHHMMGGEHYPHALSKVTTKPDGSSERTMIAVARKENTPMASLFKGHAKASGSDPNVKWEYTYEETPE